jgi:putative hemolysin
MNEVVNNNLSISQNVKALNDEWLYYISPRFLTYRPKEKIFFQTEKYTLKTAEGVSELVELFRLRHSVFLSETHNEELLDVDQYDSECDHILIRCNKTNDIVGTYRVITANNHVGFYSESEFQLDNFLKSKSIKMELGRACIHPYHRNGHVIDLLWRGIGEYSTRINAQFIFGCSSTPIWREEKVLGLLKYLEQDSSHSNEFEIEPVGKYDYPLNNEGLVCWDNADFYKKLIPPLLQSYINAGAKVYGRPAIDNEFDCLDFFTIIEVATIKSSYKKRYFKNEL